MKNYLVGGAVRDRLLGWAVKDRDYVVVGETPESMIAAGFKPVGEDFPVFLHPETKEEYALARTERKSGHGYQGFTFHCSPEVTLEEDLMRRDLTINAIAEDGDGSLIDPFGGCKDIENKVLRHVSPAFSEDPVRILRLARFAARLPEFSVSEETNELIHNMVESGEADHLVNERIWAEIRRGLDEDRPGRMFAMLDECGLAAKILPGLASEPAGKAADAAADAKATLSARFGAVMLAGTGSFEKTRAICERYRVPKRTARIAAHAVEECGHIARATSLSADDLVDLLARLNIIQHENSRLGEVLAACAACGVGDEQGTKLLHTAAEAMKGADAAAVAAAAKASVDGNAREAVRQERIRAVKKAIDPD